MADQLALLQEAHNRGILPPDKEALYQEAMRRGLIAQPATDKGPHPGVYTPTGGGAPVSSDIAPTGEGSPLAGTTAGAYNVIRQGVLTPVAGLAELGAMATGNDPEAVGNAVTGFGAINGGGAKTQAANAAVQDAVGTVLSAPAKGMDWLYTQKQRALANSPLANLPENKAALSADTEARDRMALNVVGNSLPLLLGPKGSNAVAAKAPKTVTPIEFAQSRGFKVSPNAAAKAGVKAPIGQAVQGLTSAVKTDRLVTAHNANITDAIAAKELGLPQDKPITFAALKQAKAPHNAGYEAVANLGEITTDPKYAQDLADLGRTPGGSFPKAKDAGISELRDQYSEPKFNAADALLEIKSLRQRASKNIKNPFDAKANELGFAQQKVANAIEDQLDRAAAATGNQDLIKNFRADRVALAKINTVKSALKGGRVSAPILLKMRDKGVPLSGGLADIAQVAEHFPDVMKDASKLKDVQGLTKWDATFGGGGALGALLTGHPEVAAGIAGYTLGQPAARAALLSKAYQGRLSRPAAPAIRPGLKAVLPTMAAQSLLTGNQQRPGIKELLASLSQP